MTGRRRTAHLAYIVQLLEPLRAKLFWGNIYGHLHFLSLLTIEKVFSILLWNVTTNVCYTANIMATNGMTTLRARTATAVSYSSQDSRGVSILRCRLTLIRIPMLKIRRSRDRHIFNMGISTWHHYIFYMEENITIYHTYEYFTHMALPGTYIYGTWQP